MKILELETFGHGGLAHYVYNLVGALAERDHQVSLMTTVGYELAARTLPPGADVQPILARRTGGAAPPTPGLAAGTLRKAEALTDALRAAAAIRRLAPDVIHLHCTNPVAAWYLSLLRCLNRPLVFTAHVVTPHEPMPLQKIVFGRAHRLADQLIAHSDGDRCRLIRELSVSPGKVTVIPHGDYAFFDELGEPVSRHAARRHLGLDEVAPVALFFGYVREYKGLDILLDAWSTVLERCPNARLLIAGNADRMPSSRRRELVEWATRVGALHRFEYVPLGEVRRYFAAADALVMPYRSISQSGILYLGLSLGVPIVATNVGGIGEVLEHRDSALLVPPESAAALAEAVAELLDDAALRRKLIRGGRAIAVRHGWPVVAERTEALFRQLVAERRRS